MLDLEDNNFILPIDFFTEEGIAKVTAKKTWNFFRSKPQSKFTAEVHLRQTCDMESPTKYTGSFGISKKGSFLVHKIDEDYVLIPIDNVAFIKLLIVETIE